jgi:hypothetical protein
MAWKCQTTKLPLSPKKETQPLHSTENRRAQKAHFGTERNCRKQLMDPDSRPII